MVGPDDFRPPQLYLDSLQMMKESIICEEKALDWQCSGREDIASKVLDISRQLRRDAVTMARLEDELHYHGFNAGLGIMPCIVEYAGRSRDNFSKVTYQLCRLFLAAEAVKAMDANIVRRMILIDYKPEGVAMFALDPDVHS